MAKLYAKIYTTSDGELVLEGFGKEAIEGIYYPTGDGRFGTVVLGSEHIGITPGAKTLFQQIVHQAQKTGDDVSCLDIFQSAKGVCVSWIGDVRQRICPKTMDEEGFFIGCGEGLPQLDLLDVLAVLDPETMEVLSRVAPFTV